ncbi:hypothetical protein [Balneicella halophila]|uniref:hypothetical protein n=1 Tax=Balneicella halophila TaxID=1537566 RepID=UPI001A9C77C0|nr:hypothetical protein [Balneicella halophila]
MNTGTMNNPLYIAEHDMNLSKYTRIISNNSLNWITPIENLSFTSRINIDWNTFSYKTYQNPILGDGETSNGTGSQTTRNRVTYSIQNSLNYFWEISEDHKLDFTLLQE